jgi:hypothetical protein
MNRSKTEVIMSRLLKPFDELSLKVIAVATSDNRDVALQFPVWNLQARSPAATTRFEQLRERRRNTLAESGVWHHGGLNE